VLWATALEQIQQVSTPVESVLEPLPKAQITADSFGGNEGEYQQYLERSPLEVEGR
jgi:hypothetical protein